MNTRKSSFSLEHLESIKKLLGRIMRLKLLTICIWLISALSAFGAEIKDDKLVQTKAALLEALQGIYAGDHVRAEKALLDSGIVSVEAGKESVLGTSLVEMKKVLCDVYGDEKKPLRCSEEAIFVEPLADGGFKSHIFYAIAHKSGPVYWSFEVTAKGNNGKVTLETLNSGDQATKALSKLRAPEHETAR